MKKKTQKLYESVTKLPPFLRKNEKIKEKNLEINKILLIFAIRC
jgi:hypothetical protein